MSEATTIEEDVTLDELITMLSETRAEIKAAEEAIKPMSKRKIVIEQKIMDKMADQGLLKAGGDKASVSIKEEMVPSVDPEHWEDVWQYLFNNGYTSLLYRRLLGSGWKELVQNGEEIPHVSAQIIKKLNFRNS